ncbi:hypothetical protein B0T25DRAFT_154485 [Lasiosphaeria hispida]|uniref:Uncharacterized protein n=1 Tax=Lasiosphaeria hispida TaxID=260671 RepID=A0AAJ0HLY0_9PEZI|nr:hypothetical protein B0T25DRAFT_154485 [Lasiosphaeria hispida]
MLPDCSLSGHPWSSCGMGVQRQSATMRPATGTSWVDRPRARISSSSPAVGTAWDLRLTASRACWDQRSPKPHSSGNIKSLNKATRRPGNRCQEPKGLREATPLHFLTSPGRLTSKRTACCVTGLQISPRNERARGPHLSVRERSVLLLTTTTTWCAGSFARHLVSPCRCWCWSRWQSGRQTSRESFLETSAPGQKRLRGLAGLQTPG